MDYRSFFVGKRVTLMGLGLLGRGVGDAEFMAPLCKELIITDRKSEAELASSLQRLKKFSNIRYTLGRHLEEDFIQTDMVIKAAGVPLDSPYIAAAHKAGVPVYMSTALFAQFAQEAGAVVVGITGTRGKSTVTHLIAHILKSADKKVLLGGNVRGLSTLAQLPQVTPDTTSVLELDSWQLQGFGDLHMSPNVAVFTNLMSDHLNYYQKDEERYFWDKANIFLHQKTGDKLIVGASLLGRIQASNPPVAPVVAPPLPSGWRLNLVGEHNKENAALAVLAARVLGVKEETLKEALESFEPVEGRLQLVREINGVKIYNDNNATTPDATLAALKSFTQPVILIAGGADKNLELGGLVTHMKNCKKVLLLAGTGTDRIKQTVESDLIYQVMADAVKDAYTKAEPGDVIVFSPAFASFGLFKNEYDRNDQFLEAVQKLQ